MALWPDRIGIRAHYLMRTGSAICPNWDRPGRKIRAQELVPGKTRTKSPESSSRSLRGARERSSPIGRGTCSY
jgi:hypothetical protein